MCTTLYLNCPRRRSHVQPDPGQGEKGPGVHKEEERGKASRVRIGTNTHYYDNVVLLSVSSIILTVLRRFSSR